MPSNKAVMQKNLQAEKKSFSKNRSQSRDLKQARVHSLHDWEIPTTAPKNFENFTEPIKKSKLSAICGILISGGELRRSPKRKRLMKTSSRHSVRTKFRANPVNTSLPCVMKKCEEDV
jgi:hypothetical protein